MTREEAKDVFLNRGYVKVNGGEVFDGNLWRQSLVVISEWLKEQEPCEDAINREDTEECKELMTDINGDTVYAVRMSDIRRLSPVTPKQKMGRWIEHKHNGISHLECSECSVWFSRIHLVRNSYCPNCGAKMESEGKE